MGAQADFDFEMVLKAADFAARFHSKQRRKTLDEPYINHLIRVARNAVIAKLSSNAVAAALLHDVLEDTDATVEELEAEFPSEVVGVVLLLTQWWEDEAPIEFRRREWPKYYGAIARNPDALNIKLLDRADNLNDMARAIHVVRTKRWAEVYWRRTQEEFVPLMNANPDPFCLSAYENALAALRSQLDGHVEVRPQP